MAKSGPKSVKGMKRGETISITIRIPVALNRLLEDLAEKSKAIGGNDTRNSLINAALADRYLTAQSDKKICPDSVTNY